MGQDGAPSTFCIWFDLPRGGNRAFRKRKKISRAATRPFIDDGITEEKLWMSRGFVYCCWTRIEVMYCAVSPRFPPGAFNSTALYQPFESKPLPGDERCGRGDSPPAHCLQMYRSNKGTLVVMEDPTALTRF